MVVPVESAVVAVGGAMNTLKSVLKPKALYIGDNGRMYCVDCAGASASLTGYDISGQKVHKVTKSDVAWWLGDMGKPMACDCGKVILGTDGE